MCVVEAFVEEEFSEVGERGEEKWVESGVRGTRWGWCFIGNVAEVEFNNMCVLWLVLVIVANDAVWGGETEIIGEECLPWYGWVEGSENIVECCLFFWVNERLVLRE